MKGSTVLQALYRSTKACKNPRLPNTSEFRHHNMILIYLIYWYHSPCESIIKHHWHQSLLCLLGTKPVRQLVRVPNQLLCHQLAESRGCSWWAQPAYGNCDHLWPFRIDGLLYFAASECRWWRRSAPGSKMHQAHLGALWSSRWKNTKAQAIITRKPT